MCYVSPKTTSDKLSMIKDVDFVKVGELMEAQRAHENGEVSDEKWGEMYWNSSTTNWGAVVEIENFLEKQPESMDEITFKELVNSPLGLRNALIAAFHVEAEFENAPV